MVCGSTSLCVIAYYISNKSLSFLLWYKARILVPNNSANSYEGMSTSSDNRIARSFKFLFDERDVF